MTISRLDPVLVAGATGLLGGAVTRQLLDAGFAVRALGRSRERLQPLADAGAEVIATDLRDAAAVDAACVGAQQVVTTANNVLGRGATSPNRVDLAAYRTLAASAARAGVARWIHVSARGLSADSVVDYFRVKHAVDDVVRRSGVPWVLVQPSAFMETWIDIILAQGMQEKGTATLFGDGNRVSNYISVADVAQFIVAIAGRPEVRHEAVGCGGPSEVSMRALVSLLEPAMGITVKRRGVPLAVLRAGSVLLRPLNELAARMMALGAFAASSDQRYPEWKASADRFGVSPRTVEQYIAERMAGGGFGSARA